MKSNFDALKACVRDSLEWGLERCLLSDEQYTDFRFHLGSCFDTAELAEFCRILKATMRGEKI